MTKKDLLSPRIFAFARIHGAGKTTFIQKKIKTGVLPADAFIHDCDAVIQNFEEYQNDFKLQLWHFQMGYSCKPFV